jgi:uncharacterized membrane protein YeaQ/YmgE (transglycosylase-associated protein family)
MSVIFWVVIGVVGGWLLAMLVKHSSRNLIDIVFGLAGSLLGSFVANSGFGIPSTSVYAFISAVVGAVIFIFLGRLRSVIK